ncbi:PrgI family protein [Candidatus Saccharibacteria bacterium]|nr:PrgI family protein [Candidatus Saccharibacteria bacterium]
MAQYKVPQDVEADDKLIGPFSFRQFVYLLIAAGLIALAVGLFQIFPLLAIIPAPFVFFFLALALPLKKDQPMETYLAAIVSYYLKPHSRVWMPGQKESTILITAPKIVEAKRTRDISSEEATHRLSFLADIVDTGGLAIKGAGASPMREDLVAEANATPDMFEAYQSQVLNRVIDQDKMSRHNDAVKEMREAIQRNKDSFSDNLDEGPTVGGEKVLSRPEITMPEPEPEPEPELEPVVIMPEKEPKITEEEMQIPKVSGDIIGDTILKPDVDIENSDVVVRPEIKRDTTFEKVRVPGGEKPGVDPDLEEEPEESEKPKAKKATKPVNSSIMELANNKDFSVATIAKEANRINKKDKGKDKGEVFISLH